MRKNVLITGASGGIGSALALAFAERGYGVAMQYHSREQAARETAERICSGGGTAEIFSADTVSYTHLSRFSSIRVGEVRRLEAAVCAAEKSTGQG